MEQSFCAVNSLLSELNYELRIRGIVTDRKQDDKRKTLAKLLSKERQKDFDVQLLSDSFYDFNVEQNEINTTLSSLETVIHEFDGPTSDSAYKRAVTRLEHVANRIKRIRVNESDENYAVVLKYKNESFATAMLLDAELHERVQDSHSQPLHNSTVANNLNSTSAQIGNNVHNLTSSSRSIPVYKLGIHFDGEPKNLLNFIEKVEEMAQARHINKTELFESASDLFAGKATYWFRQIKPLVSDWDSLVARLKKDFLVSDFDDEIWNQIKARKQGRTEPVVIFIACMETLFSRLSRPASEISKIKYMKLGLQAEYRKRLALSDIDSVSTMSTLCKRLEEADILSLASSSKSVSSLIDPELAYIANSTPFRESSDSRPRKNKHNSYNRQKNPKNNVTSSIEVEPTNKVISCWRCGLANHMFRNCKSGNRNKFCFKCGTVDVTIKDCPKCNSKN
ncbi:uncharacterized protein [Leptinotarsa decemlineata]|uniref:uncharacterized protein n=1 Tax=Leptinotarsa decemlineata TaxID=7539 RepID=UPI003D307498